MHPVTDYKAIKNKINKTRQHRIFILLIFLTNKTKTKTHTKNKVNKQ